MLKNLSRYNQKFLNNFNKQLQTHDKYNNLNIFHAIKQSFGCLLTYIFYILPNDKK